SISGRAELSNQAHITTTFRKLGVKNRTQAVIALQQLDIRES
ncbi:DNA-binding response regulator, partial [Aeromonas australiensis]|nr:DNA-binding response regulator [Aeromonas australiensis]MCF3099974.1 DNA-binding response regulator [Aeromonas australiensis]